MLKGLQTHFGSPIGVDLCTEIRAKQWTLARIDAQACSVETMLQMVEECYQASLLPYVTVATYEHIAALPAYALCEWRNEPDIHTSRYTPADEYAKEFVQACQVAARNPVAEVGGPVTSNLNKRGVAYIEQFMLTLGRRLPFNAFGVTHRYGHKGLFTPEFSTCHKLSWKPWGDFKSRKAEYDWFKRTIGPDHMWVVSEGGWASTEGISEEKQAQLARNEFALAEECGAFAYIWYQLNDGHSSFGIDNFGIRHGDRWKPVANIFL